MDNIFKNQLILLEKVKKYNYFCLKKKIDPSLNPWSFMTTWVKTHGYFKLNDLMGHNKKKFFFLLKDLISISGLHDLKSFYHSNNYSFKKKIIDTIIISYCSKKDFDSNGVFYDKYFGISSKNKNYLWFLISLDHFLPKKVNNNIIILKKINKNKFNFFFFIKKFLSKKNFYTFSNSTVFSEIISESFLKLFSDKVVKNLVINYEAIPFQHSLIQIIKKININTNVLCYLHCAGWALQTELMYKEKKIDKLFVSSYDQRNNLIKYFNWPPQKIKFIPSLRFRREKNDYFSKKIFVPFEIYDDSKILQNFENFIISFEEKSLNKFSFKIHPLNFKSEKHRNFKTKIQKIIERNESKFSNKLKKKISVFIGTATGVCAQAIEDGVIVYHLPCNPILDVFSEEIWPNIKVRKILDNVYEYSLRKKNKLFLVNNQKNKFNKYLKPFLK